MDFAAVVTVFAVALVAVVSGCGAYFFAMQQARRDVVDAFHATLEELQREHVQTLRKYDVKRVGPRPGRRPER